MNAHKRDTARTLLFGALAIYCISGCASISSGKVHRVPYLRIGYVHPGDAPVVTLMDVDKEIIRFGSLGGRMVSRRISPSQAEPIFRGIFAGVLDDVQISPGIGLHDAEIWIEVDGVSKAGFLADNPPQTQVDLLRAVKELFAEEFGSRFDYMARHLP